MFQERRSSADPARMTEKKPKEKDVREDLFFLRDDLARAHADLGQQVAQLRKDVERAGEGLEKLALEREAAAAREREAAALERAADKGMASQALEGVRQALSALEGRLAAAEAALQEARSERDATRREFSKMIHDFGGADRALVERGLLVMERKSAEQLERFLKSLDARDQQLRSELKEWFALLRQEVSQEMSRYMKHPEFESGIRPLALRSEIQPKLEEAAARLANLEKGVDKMQTGFETGVKQILVHNLRVLEAELRTFVKELDRDRLDDVRTQLARLEGRVGALEGPKAPRSPAEAKLEATAARKVATKAVAEAVQPLQEQLEQLRKRIEQSKPPE